MTRVVWLLAGSLLFVVPAFLVATARPLSAEESYTFHLSQLSTGELWNALHSGVVSDPPLSYLAARAAVAALGDTTLALRVPSLVGGWLLAVATFLFAGRMLTLPFAALAMLLPLLSLLWPTLSSARPYAMAAGCVALAVLCWQTAAAGRARPWSVGALGLTLGAAIASDYGAAAVVLVLAAGEWQRWRHTRIVDRAVAGALLGALLPLLILASQRWAREGPALVWPTPYTGDPYQLLLAPAALLIVALLVLTAMRPAFSRALPASATPASLSGELPSVEPGLPFRMSVAPTRSGEQPSHALADPLPTRIAPDIVMCVALVVLPVVVWSAQGSSPDSVLAMSWSVVGTAVLLALAAERLLAPRALLAATLALIVVAGVSLRTWHTLQQASEHRAERQSTIRLLDSRAESTGPLVVGDPAAFLALSTERHGSLRQRITYLASPEASLRHLGHDATERQLLALARWAPLRVEALRTFSGPTTGFALYCANTECGWLLQELSSARVTRRAQDGPRALWDVLQQ